MARRSCVNNFHESPTRPRAELGQPFRCNKEPSPLAPRTFAPVGSPAVGPRYPVIDIGTCACYWALVLCGQDECAARCLCGDAALDRHQAPILLGSALEYARPRWLGIERGPGPTNVIRRRGARSCRIQVDDAQGVAGVEIPNDGQGPGSSPEAWDHRSTRVSRPVEGSGGERVRPS